MSSDAAPEPVDWGTSFGRFGSDSSADAADPDRGSLPAASKRKGLSRSASSSFGSRGAGGLGRGAPRPARRGRSSDRPPADDPFGPVVGGSADRDADGIGPGGGTGGRSAGSGPRRRGGRRGPADPDAPLQGADPSEDPTGGPTPRSVEEWTGEARGILLRQLALGPRSRHQLAGKLADRGVPASVASALLERFEEVQLIDDAEFARMWVRTRTAAKSLSRSSLRRELADKGIDPDLAEDALLQISDEDELGQARDVVRRKLRGSTDLSDRTIRDREVRRLVGVLARKGYSPGAAFSIVKDVLAAAEAPDRPD